MGSGPRAAGQAGTGMRAFKLMALEAADAADGAEGGKVRTFHTAVGRGRETTAVHGGAVSGGSSPESRVCTSADSIANQHVPSLTAELARITGAVTGALDGAICWDSRVWADGGHTDRHDPGPRAIAGTGAGIRANETTAVTAGEDTAIKVT